MKPKHQGGYSAPHTVLCERTLVTLLRGLGPWKEGIYLAGGLVPCYLISKSNDAEFEPVPHAGTTDVDLILDLHFLATVEAYRTLEQNLKSLGLERGTNDDGQAQHFSWRKSVGGGVTVVVDLLCDAANSGNGGQVVELSRERRLSALNIPGAHLVTRDYIEVEITTDLLDGRGVSTEIVRVANIVPFLVLKALAYDDRFEEKDAYDLIYCLMNYGRGPEEVAALVADRLADRIDEELLVQALDILRARFASDEHTPGSRKDGPVSYARFLVDSGRSDLNARRRQDAADAVDRFFRTLDNEHQAMSIRSQ